MTPSQKSTTQYKRSPIKWPGSKYKILYKILPLLSGYEKVVEPFVGSAAVLINHPFNEKVINDKNKHLINFYRVVQSKPDALIKELKKLFKPENNCPDTYYSMREKFNNSRHGVRKAALFIYLSKHSFNGVMRWNNSDKFNTPVGKYKAISLPENAIFTLHHKLQNVKIVHGDFEACFSVEHMTKENLYYQLYRTFFSVNHHERLSRLIELAQESGAKSITCNHDLTITRELHSKATKIISLDVPRYLSCKGQERKPVKELLAIYEPH